ncbi:hypothetical protein BURC_02818 [Burkholderiaceae bacterium]|nr:hypothetical protein BURC_02818 [Burkholderiaceae bacterium]
MDIADRLAASVARCVEPMAWKRMLCAASAIMALSLGGCAGEDKPSTSTPQSQAEAAARQAVPGMSWQGPAVTGDFSCRGRYEYAMLGINESEFAVVVFAAEQPEPIGTLRFPLSTRDPRSTVLAREDLDFTPEDFERDSGPVPEGLLPSKTCLGLSVGDGRAAPTHIYWNRQAKRFATWTR